MAETKKRTWKCKKKKHFALYSVYDGKTTLPLIIDGTAEQCARRLGITVSYFYYAVYRSHTGKLKKWEIYSRHIKKKAVAQGG